MISTRTKTSHSKELINDMDSLVTSTRVRATDRKHQLSLPLLPLSTISPPLPTTTIATTTFLPTPFKSNNLFFANLWDPDWQWTQHGRCEEVKVASLNYKCMPPSKPHETAAVDTCSSLLSIDRMKLHVNNTSYHWTDKEQTIIRLLPFSCGFKTGKQRGWPIPRKRDVLLQPKPQLHNCVLVI
ncbi:hypothetical protein UPYG_G00011480 [Umbra pygmaea]|uniref:Uncharacterized protein n=1 Tax=Umbra pygmaea TaxID=75934 RepID=A0ABD0XIN5_UMBPY